MERLGLSFKKFTPLILVLFCITLPILLIALTQLNLDFNHLEEFSKPKVLEAEDAQNATTQISERKPQNDTPSTEVGSRNSSIITVPNATSSSQSTSTSGDQIVSNTTSTSQSSSIFGDQLVSNSTSLSQSASISSDKLVSNTTSLSQSASISSDKLLGGLLATGFDKGSCLSRYKSYLYRKDLLHTPSSYLISKLRNYEDLHRQCGPHTKAYNRTIRMLKSSHVKGPAVCNYVIWIGSNGLGNRMMSIVSTFLYAVLTDRVLLVDFGTAMTGLFCEPFLNSSWLLPNDFPYKTYRGEIQTYESFLKNNIAKEFLPSFLFVNIKKTPDDADRIFHCNDSQSLLQQVPALILKSDQYFVPYLFMIPSFKKELTSKMFPDKETVFYHLGHYLFHPSNKAWGLITSFYKANLAGADKRIGLQIRVFARRAPDRLVMDQILACTIKHNILPEVDEKKTMTSVSKNRTSKAVLVTSLYSNYTENLRRMYQIAPTSTGEVVGVYQPSHEEQQKFNDNIHYMKAWADMYLLSLCDVLVTSAHSTFGYVAQSLGGLKPWILRKPNGRKTPDPPCKLAMSMEPCFHYPPKYDNCISKTEINFKSLSPHLRPCEDSSKRGVKLVDKH